MHEILQKYFSEVSPQGTLIELIDDSETMPETVIVLQIEICVEMDYMEAIGEPRELHLHSWHVMHCPAQKLMSCFMDGLDRKRRDILLYVLPCLKLRSI